MIDDTGKRLKVLVLGDSFTDHYHVGEFTRFAPEGGQPIFVERESIVVPGGAGNTARQLAHWNCDVTLIGNDAGTKHRYVAGDNYFLRVDDDATYSSPIDIPDDVSEFDGMILSDYDKGALNETTIKSIIGACKARDIPCFADPKGKPIATYQGAIVKANAAYLYGPAHVVTRGALPPVVQLQELPSKPPVHAVSVVGAGDCFHASLACAYLRGASLRDAATVAYSAGRVYVQRPYNEPVRPIEVAKDIDPIGGKITTAAALAGMPLSVLANGGFDLLHPGHVHTLEWARRQGYSLVVAVNTDESFLAAKGRWPRLALSERCKMLAALSCVDYVVPFGESTPRELVKQLGVKIIVKGDDSRGEPIPGSEYAEVRFAPPCEFTRHSSTLQ